MCHLFCITVRDDKDSKIYERTVYDISINTHIRSQIRINPYHYHSTLVLIILIPYHFAPRRIVCECMTLNLSTSGFKNIFFEWRFLKTMLLSV